MCCVFLDRKKITAMLWLIVVALSACARAALYSPYGADYDEYNLLPKPAARYPYYGYPPIYDDAYAARAYYGSPVADEDPVRMEERAAREAALPVGQETWYESEPPPPRWRQAGLDDVNAAFLQNLIISQMARNAENRARAYAASPYAVDEPDEDAYVADHGARDSEDEEVRELKALAGKPLYHTAKTANRIPVPTNGYDYYDYPADDTFINWGSKRSGSAPPAQANAAPGSTRAPPEAAAAAQAAAAEGQREEVQLRPATPVRHPFPDPVMKALQNEWRHDKRSDDSYNEIKHMLAAEHQPQHQNAYEERMRLQKRFVASDQDVVAELRGLKRHIAT